MSFSVIDSLKKTLMVKPHPAGMPFIIGGIVTSLLLMPISDELCTISLIFTIFCLYFFRDPERVTPQVSSLMIAPADGIVSSITEGLSLPPEIAVDPGQKYTRISIFLSVLDVHVNRIPLSGKIIRRAYRPGKFLNADLDKASEENERCSFVIEAENDIKICVVQIAGMIARRIVNQLDQDQSVTAGARFGIIRFGSRVDTYIPDGIAPLVCVGQRAVGAETVLADLANKETARKGAVVSS
jgi:phosphatidylserine decarboxylase